MNNKEAVKKLKRLTDGAVYAKQGVWYHPEEGDKEYYKVSAEVRGKTYTWSSTSSYPDAILELIELISEDLCL